VTVRERFQQAPTQPGINRAPTLRNLLNPRPSPIASIIVVASIVLVVRNEVSLCGEKQNSPILTITEHIVWAAKSASRLFATVCAERAQVLAGHGGSK
jgi:hypothetical protein